MGVVTAALSLLHVAAVHAVLAAAPDPDAATPSPSPTTSPDYGSSREFLERMLREASPSPGPFAGFAGPAGRLLGVVLFLVLVVAVLGLAVSLIAAIGSIRKGSRASGWLLTAVGCAFVIVLVGAFTTFTLGWFDLLT